MKFQVITAKEKETIRAIASYLKGYRYALAFHGAALSMYAFLSPAEAASASTIGLLFVANLVFMGAYLPLFLQGTEKYRNITSIGFTLLWGFLVSNGLAAVGGDIAFADLEFAPNGNSAFWLSMFLLIGIPGLTFATLGKSASATTSSKNPNRAYLDEPDSSGFIDTEPMSHGVDFDSIGKINTAKVGYLDPLDLNDAVYFETPFETTLAND